MSRRNLPCPARQVLGELTLNAHGDIVDLDEKHDDPPVDLSILSLAAAANENVPPAAAARPARKRRGKYNPRLTYEQRDDILKLWMDGWSAPKIIAHYALKSIPLKLSTLDTLLRRLRREDRIGLHSIHHIRRLKYSHLERKQMADINKAHNAWTYDQIVDEWRLWWGRMYNRDAPNALRPSH